MALRFTAAARKHRIGRRRCSHVIRHAVAVLPVLRPQGDIMLMILGDDEHGVALEVGVILEGGDMIVMHAMQLRSKFRSAYEEGKNR